MSKVRIGIVGAGHRVCFHGGCVFSNGPMDAGCEEDITLAALCDNRPDRVAHAKGLYEKHFGGEIAAYADYEKMYREAGLDGVYVAGPNDLHRDMTLAALDRGLHVLCEKPMEVTLARCDEMIVAARKAGRILAFARQMRYRVRYHRVKELIRQGVIGQPAMVWCTEYRTPFPQRNDWVWDKRRSGGAIVEKNCHHYDIFNLWLDSEPTTVYATGNIRKVTTSRGRPSDLIDNAWVVNDFANGARGMLGICFLASDPQKHYREFGVQGAEGKIFFNLEDGETLHIECASGERMTVSSQEVLRGGVFRDFVDCVRTGGEPLVTPPIARRSLLVPIAAEKSIEEKRVVQVSELR